jgi:NADH:ubiquinone reductase (H+-translocating)
MPALPGLREQAIGLKDLTDAIRLRNHVLRQIELADAAPEAAARRLTFVLAGAGFAGVEVAAERTSWSPAPCAATRASRACSRAGCSSTARRGSWAVA